jgi:hypothetical protein
MDYKTLRALYKNRNAVFNGFNSADGTGTDTSTDAVITRDPNNYLAPKINGFTVYNTTAIIVALLSIAILLPMAIKSVKSFL